MLVQHNAITISKYYGQITLQRVSELMHVEKDYCEEEICSLNNKKVIRCRIDRIGGIIDFRPV
jgi:26S proteasome regulatory subunit N5